VDQAELLAAPFQPVVRIRVPLHKFNVPVRRTHLPLIPPGAQTRGMTSAGKQAGMAARREKWRGIVRGAEASGLSLRAYCKQHEIDLSQFYYWRRVLQTAGRQAEQQAEQQASRGAFVLLQAPGRNRTAVQSADQTPALELLLERGWRLRIPRGVDEALLASTLRLLAAGS